VCLAHGRWLDGQVGRATEIREDAVRRRARTYGARGLTDGDLPGREGAPAVLRALLPKLRAVAGVEAASASDAVPAAGNGGTPIELEGHAYVQDRDYPDVLEGRVTPDFFQTFQVAVMRGRGFTTADTAASEHVAVVNESFARRFYAGSDPIGHRLRRGRGDAQAPWQTIIGVVPDLLMEGIGNGDQSPVGFYRPIAQVGAEASSLTVAVRTLGDAAAAADPLRSALESIDADLSLYDVLTMAQVIHKQTFFFDVFGTLFTGFGASALLLAAAGLYGVMSFAVTQRTREMGVRSALGARGTQLVRLIMRRSVVQLMVGLVLGLGLGLAASGPLETVLFNVGPRDPLVIATVVVVLSLTSLVATALPAWRVTRVDPVIALSAD
jgi:putative ABC transport system permease protein